MSLQLQDTKANKPFMPTSIGEVVFGRFRCSSCCSPIAVQKLTMLHTGNVGLGNADRTLHLLSTVSAQIASNVVMPTFR